MADIVLGEVTWERMIRAVEKVRERLLLATAGLEKAGVPYALIGDHAVAAWVSRVDEAATRTEKDVELRIRRHELEAARVAMEAAGFIYRYVKSMDMFLDSPDAKARDAVHVIFAGEKVRPDDPAPAAAVDESERATAFRVVTLEALVRMKLTSYRLKDRMHLRDVIDVGLIDGRWVSRLDEPLAGRLQEMLDNPEG